MKVEIVPCTWNAAKRMVALWHRHLPHLTGSRFSCALAEDGVNIAVGVAGTPSRAWNEQRKIVIDRIAVQPATDPGVNACSRLYGRLCRAAEALGYLEVWTYTLPEEPGTSLRAAGFEEMGLTRGGEWDRPSRARGQAMRAEPKKRWRRRLGAKGLA